MPEHEQELCSPKSRKENLKKTGSTGSLKKTKKKRKKVNFLDESDEEENPKKTTKQNPVQQLCPYEKVREANIKERTELARKLNINQLSKRLKEAEIPDADETLLAISDDEI